MTPEPMNTQNYFEEIGAWPKGSNKVGYAYATGFVLSLLLTFATYFCVTHFVFPMAVTLILIAALACAQFVIQMMCFLHLGKETESRERLVILGCVAIIVLILVSGSLWIMLSLNGRMMPSTQQMEQFMNNQAGI
jgi:cytochrome o ubiquinol oxidase operon protein cyoD